MCIRDSDSALLMFNAAGNPVEFTVPPADYGEQWTVAVTTDGDLTVGTHVEPGTVLERPGYSTLVLGRAPMDFGDDEDDVSLPQTPAASVLSRPLATDDPEQSEDE